MADGAAQRILLIGMMGAGKSTVGGLLASRLHWPYLDSDEEIKRRTGRSVPEIWHAEGEKAFRSQEAAVLSDAVGHPGPAVIAVAGGAVLDPSNRDRIRSAGLVVWLRAETATLVGRVGDGQGRPLLDDDPVQAITSLYDTRRPVYADLAELVVDVDHRSPDQIVDVIIGERARRASS